ncbi:MAG: succinate dehydrogenase, hydrophobic membrane anchor protein [Gammaproteobacteria bacterium]|nr:MAG: succinate dehydrogenase, hydrophobic membrane anchor protein [Gammaproteobacteria bacterium]
MVMVKSVLSVAHKGFRDWAIQRATAIVMGIYSIGLIGYLLFNPGLSFAEWHTLFSQDWMKVVTLLFILSVLYHAWIGIWTVFTDYVKLYVIRCILNFLVLFMLIACFFWGVLILWSV